MIAKLDFSAGAYRGAFLEFHLNGTELRVEYSRSLPENEGVELSLTLEQIQYLTKELEKAKVRNWAIVDPPVVHDGYDWSLSISWDNGETINLYGQQVYPDGNGGFHESKTREWRRFYNALKALSPIQFD